MNVTREMFADVMVPNYNPAAMVPVKGLGSKVWDQDGNEFIDLGQLDNLISELKSHFED